MNARQGGIYAVCGLSVALAGSLAAQSAGGLPPFSPMEPELERLYSEISAPAVEPPLTQVVPDAIAPLIHAALVRDYQNRLTNVRITASKAVVWQDCVPDAAQGQMLTQPCEVQNFSGWRTEVAGEFPSLAQSIERVYYADDQGLAIVPDHLGSLSEAVRSEVAQALKLPVDQLTFLAAQEESFYPATGCPQTGICPIPPLGLSWRILVQAQGVEHLVNVSSLGSQLHTPERDAFFSEADRSQLGTLPLAWANAVVQDAQTRLLSGEILPPPNLPEGVPTGAEIDFQVEAIRSVTWNACRGGTGPTQPIRGNCPDITVAGWQMIIVGGLKQAPFRLVYYIPEPDSSGLDHLGLADQDVVMPGPDAMQSLPAEVRTRILEAAAEDTGLPTTTLQLHGVEARWWDACLNTAPQRVSCHNGIRPGWRIEILGVQSVPAQPWATPLWIYHANLTGTEVHLVHQGQWSPPPSAPPPQP